MNKTHWKLPANVHPAWSQKCPGRGSAPYFIHISRGKRLERIPENHEMASTKKTAAETLCKLPTTASANAHQKSIPEPNFFNSRLWCLDFAAIKSNQINSNQTTYPNNHNINNITSGVQYQATTASVNNLKVFPTLRGLRSLPLHLRVSIHLHASNTYTVIVCFLELLLMRVHTLRSNPKIQKPLTPKHCWKHKTQKHSYGKQMLE